jgi:PAS domain S-box-containing protein
MTLQTMEGTQPSQVNDAERQLSSIKSIFENQNDLSFSLFQHMPIGICVTDSRGYFTDVNASYCDIYGYTKQELIGLNFTEIVPEETRELLMNHHEEFMEKEYELQGKWKVQDKKGEQFDIIANAAFLRDVKTDEKRKMTLVVRAEELEDTILRLETTIEILEKKLETQDIANRLAEHDLRNRLSSIVSIATILSSSDIDEEQNKWVETIKRIGKDTLHLLSSARDYAKMERGEYEANIQEFDLIASIATVTKDYIGVIAEKELEILMLKNNSEVEPDEDKLMIQGDQFYLEHLFQNLIGNAIEASPKKESILIEITSDKEFKINISNKGFIPTDIQGRFFEKYTTSGKDRGTGLGTYIAKMIAEFHGGNITFISNEKDGTTLIVHMPSGSLI